MPWLLETLPSPLRAALVHGSEGSAHLAGCAAMAASAGLDALASELLLAAWAESPLDANLAGRAACLPGIDRAAAALAAHVAEHSAPPADLSYYRRLAERRDISKIRSYLERQTEKEPGNLFWERLGLTHAMDCEEWEWADAILTRLPAPLALVLGGDAAMLRGEAGGALAGYAKSLGLWRCPGIEARMGLAHLLAQEGRGPDAPEAPAPRLSGTKEPDHKALAGRWLRESLGREPWRTQGLLVLHDLITGRKNTRRPLEGGVEVLLYTWNKAQDIDRTLASLFAGGLSEVRAGARVTVLDNGSTDDTPEALAGWRDRAGGDRLRVVTLPVNVGAPAARNWLLALPQVKESAWVAFLDDDVSLPPDWLGLLGAATEFYPMAGVWGARVADFSRRSHIQSADVFLTDPPGGGADPGRPGSRRFGLSSCHHQTLDRGQFAYARPCATVTGCCHLFRTDLARSLGGFDLRYSPSQYDDLDHDIRVLLSGATPVCQGHLAVGHFKSTGGQGGVGQAQYGVGFANQYKLHQKFTAEEFRRAARLADDTAWRDLLSKWREWEDR